jgi:hypothetical protein
VTVLGMVLREAVLLWTAGLEHAVGSRRAIAAEVLSSKKVAGSARIWLKRRLRLGSADLVEEARARASGCLTVWSCRFIESCRRRSPMWSNMPRPHGVGCPWSLVEWKCASR